jgi:Recombination endonuclease VII
MWTEEARQQYKRSPEGNRAACRKYRQAHHERTLASWRKWNLRARYGLNQEELEKILAKQGGACAICGKTDAGGRGRFHIDHDHRCCPRGRACRKCIRGLLCHHCNTALGKFGDSVEILEKAIAYLKKGNVNGMEIRARFWISHHS